MNTTRLFAAGAAVLAHCIASARNMDFIYEESGNGASFSIWTLIAIVVFFGGIAWYFMRAEDENAAFGKLAFAVIALIAGSSLYRCVS